MQFVSFKNKGLEDKAEKILVELGINSLMTLEGKKGRIYIFEEKYLDDLGKAGIKYKILPEIKIEKYLTDRGSLYLRNIRASISL